MRFIGTWAAHAKTAGHNGPITCLEWSPDGRFLASGSYDGTVIIWGVSDWSVLHNLWHSRLVNGVRWSPDQEWLASASADGHCRVWDVKTGSERFVFSRHTDDVNTIAWSPNSSELMTVSEDGTGRLWRLHDYALGQGVVVHEDHCMSVDWQPGGNRLVTCGEDATIRISTPVEGTLRVLAQEADLEQVRWNRRGDRFATAADDGRVLIFDDNGDEVCTLTPHGGPVKSVAWSPSGDLVASGSYDGAIRLWDVESEALVCEYYDSRIWPRALHWSPTANMVAVGAHGGRPAVLRVNLGGDLRLVRQPEPSDLPTVGINAVVTDEDLVFAGADDGTVRCWSRSSDNVERLVERSPTAALVNALAGDQTRLWFGSFDGRVAYLENGTRSRAVALGSPVNSIAVAPTGDRVAVATYEGVVHIVEPTVNGAVLRASQPINVGAIKSLVWLDGSTIAIGSTDSNLYVISVDGRVVSALRGHGNLVNAVAHASGDRGRFLASASRDRTVRVWDLDSERCVHVLVGHTESVKSVAWVDVERCVVASGSYDFDVRVWRCEADRDDPSYCSVLAHHRQGVSSLYADGSGLVTASWDGSVAWWSTDNRLLKVAELGRWEP
jgi:WD40 repeat protein